MVSVSSRLGWNEVREVSELLGLTAESGDPRAGPVPAVSVRRNAL
jgi:hypothetical protein